MSARQRAATLSAWALVWSPLASPASRAESWEALGLPGRFADVEPRYWSTFHVGAPAPRVPLVLHSALGRPGTAVREDWARVTAFLDLRWRERHLPPDHLAAACEVLAAAVENDDMILVGELCERYLSPWCRVAAERLAADDTPLGALPQCFAEDLAAAVADG